MKISEALEKLLEQGVIAGHWIAKKKFVGNSTRVSWVRAFNVTGEQNLQQLKRLHEWVTSMRDQSV